MMSMILTIISYVVGAIFRGFEQKREYEQEKWRAMMTMANAKFKDTSDARKIQTTEAQYTRRVVMILFTIGLVGLTIWGVVVGGTMIIPTLITKEPSGFFGMLFGGGASSMVKFTELPLTLSVTYAWEMFGVMVGFYFGSGGTRK